MDMVSNWDMVINWTDSVRGMVSFRRHPRLVWGSYAARCWFLRAGCKSGSGAGGLSMGLTYWRM